MSQNPVPSAPRTADDWQIPTALMTDHYELTMLQAALKAGTAHRRSRFELFTRRLPSGRRYGVVAGVGRALEGLSRFRFDTPELDFLADTTALDDATLAWLADYEFTGDIVGYAEGEAYFPHSPSCRWSRRSPRRASWRPTCSPSTTTTPPWPPPPPA